MAGAPHASWDTRLGLQAVTRQRQVLRETAGAWKAEDHPELAQGAAAWVRQIRSFDAARFEELEELREEK